MCLRTRSHTERLLVRSTIVTTPALASSRSAAESFPYTPTLDPGQQNLKVPSWLNDRP
jgi:hypothetical protein